MTLEYSIVIKRGDGSAKIVPVEFKRVLSAKAIRITPNVARQVVRVTYPIYVLRSRAAAFLESKKDWVAGEMEKLPDRTAIADGSIVPLLGRRYKVTHIPDARRGVWLEDGRMFVSGAPEFLNRRVKDFIKAEMKRYFTSAAKSYARSLGVETGNISVKDTTSRWGSCASNGNLAFSWRLAFAPVWVADYIAAHEVAHIAELNHGTRFWRRVREIYGPDMERAQKWLARNGLYLYSID